MFPFAHQAHSTQKTHFRLFHFFPYMFMLFMYGTMIHVLNAFNITQLYICMEKQQRTRKLCGKHSANHPPPRLGTMSLTVNCSGQFTYNILLLQYCNCLAFLEAGSERTIFHSFFSCISVHFHL